MNISTHRIRKEVTTQEVIKSTIGPQNCVTVLIKAMNRETYRNGFVTIFSLYTHARYLCPEHRYTQKRIGNSGVTQIMSDFQKKIGKAMHPRIIAISSGILNFFIVQ